MRLLLAAALLMSLLSANVYSQEKDIEELPKTIEEDLVELRETAVQKERDALKDKVEKINSELEKGTISKEEAEALKKDAAELHALNIENRLAIIDNEIALLERNGVDFSENRGLSISLGLGQEDVSNRRVFGLQIQDERPKIPKRRYDRRTSSGAVVAFGLNNVITNGEPLEDSDFKIGGSRFFELGWSWRTRVFENTNWVRVKYGLSFQFNGLKPTENRYFVDTGEQTELEVFPLNLKKSKFRMDNLVVPVHFEFGPSKKIEHTDYFRYSTRRQLNVGIGGYAGINMSARQKLKFKEDGSKQKQKLKADYNTNNFIYGLSGYVGWGSGSIYAKYDLNPIFKNNDKDQRNISLGLRFDLD